MVTDIIIMPLSRSFSLRQRHGLYEGTKATTSVREKEEEEELDYCFYMNPHVCLRQSTKAGQLFLLFISILDYL